MFFRSNKNKDDRLSRPVEQEPEPRSAPVERVAAVSPSPPQQAVSDVRMRGSPAKVVGDTEVAAGRPVVVRRVGSQGGYNPALGMLTHLFMQSSEHQNLNLSDLRWLALPALGAKQATIVVARTKGQTRPTPTGAVLWAAVSADVDRRLCRELAQGIRLHPEDWRSGDILWIVALLGAQETTQKLLLKLVEGPFRGRAFKMRRLGPDGTAGVVIVDPNRSGGRAA